MLSRIWLRLSLRQLLRTLGQHRAFLPLLIIGALTIPTSIVAVSEMAPHGQTIFYKMKVAADAKLVYGYLLIIGVLLFPLQLQLLQELDSSREIENLERYPLPRRSLFHFKLIDQWVMFGPLLALALLVTMAGGLYQLSHTRSEHLSLGGKGVKALAEAGSSGTEVEATLLRMARIAEKYQEGHINADLAERARQGLEGTEYERAEFVHWDRTDTLLATAREYVAEAVRDRLAKRTPRTQARFAAVVWARTIGQAARERLLHADDIVDYVPVTDAMIAEYEMTLPLSLEAQLALIALLAVLAVLVQLMLMFAVTACLGLLPAGVFGSRPMMAVLVVAGMVTGLALVAGLFPSSYFPERRQEWMPWVLVPRAVQLIQLRLYAEALAPLSFLGLYMALAYELSGWSYQRHLLTRREDLYARLTAAMADSKEDLARRRRPWIDSGVIEALWGPAVALLVTKDVKQVTRPPVNRLMILLLIVPFCALASFVTLGVLVGAPNPFVAGKVSLFGKAVMALVGYSLITLFWIPCAQIFLFSYERWGVTELWCGPFDTDTVYTGKAVAAGLMVMPAVLMAYLGMALFLSVGVIPRIGLLTVVGLVFVGSTMAIFGNLVAALGFLFPYFLQSRFRHLAGGLGFMLQMSLLPAWIATWMFGAQCVLFFRGAGLGILAGMLVIWGGFAYILAREARHAIGRIGHDHGRAGAKADAPTDAAAAAALGAAKLAEERASEARASEASGA